LATVFVGNLSHDVTDNDLREVFAKYGKILSLRLISRRGLAFVELEPPAAVAAVEGLRGTQLRDRTLDVALEQSSPGKRRAPRRR
jgi:RNA recognition motif-containing protein